MKKRNVSDVAFGLVVEAARSDRTAPLCRKCGAELTEADYGAARCTQCGDAVVLTHFVSPDAPGANGKPWHAVSALCGRLVRNDAHANEPTCPACRRARAAFEALEI